MAQLPSEEDTVLMSTAPAMPEVRYERGTRMPLEEYLRTMFHPDREYVDGVAEERPVGE